MLAETVELMGEAATVRLLQAFGGREIRVPTRQHGRTWNSLVNAIGQSAAVAFCQHFGGETLYIASIQRFERERRRALAAQMRAEGRSWREVAHVLGYTERGARKLLSKRPSNEAILGVYLGVSRKIENR